MIVAESWMAMIMGVMVAYGVIMMVGLNKKKKRDEGSQT